MISLDRLTVILPSGHPAPAPILKDISCTFAAGTVTLLVGKTGSGKSTFLHALAGLVPLSAGTVTCGGLALAKERTGIVFQYPERQLFAPTVRQEFRYSLRPLSLSKREMEERTREALGLLGLPEHILDEPVLALSEGWKRRTALATTLAARPEWLLLDEPSAGIDPQGLQPLLDVIAAHKRKADGGVIIATHDLDAFLPVADKLLVLDGGRLKAELAPAELWRNPRPLLAARVGLPSAIRISMALKEQGIVVADCPFDPEQVAEAIHRWLRQPAAIPANEAEEDVSAVLVSGNPISADVMSDAPVSSASDPLSADDGNAAAAHAETALPMAERLHPVAKWLFYLLTSIGILAQTDWFGTVVALLFTLACIRLSGVSWRTLCKPVKPFAVFILISFALSGLTVAFAADSPGTAGAFFSFSSAWRTVRHLGVFLLVTMLGILLAATTGQRKMQQGLEQILSWGTRLRLPAAALAFSASMLLRFIPLLGKEIERMSLIVRARGKADVKPGTIRLRDARVFFIPLLLSMMKSAEDMALALEARGYSFQRGGRAPAQHPPLTRMDWAFAASGAVLLGIFILLRMK